MGKLEKKYWGLFYQMIFDSKRLNWIPEKKIKIKKMDLKKLEKGYSEKIN